LHVFANCGAEHALMTGSGSSCFALIESLQTENRIRASAVDKGLRRIFTAKAWYGDSIEQQLSTQVD
jgi:4-diphosphocytidyl-2C-methyl-D-erythritol kinase